MAPSPVLLDGNYTYPVITRVAAFTADSEDEPPPTESTTPTASTSDTASATGEAGEATNAGTSMHPHGANLAVGFVAIVMIPIMN
jgi:hypothetical protein